MLKQLITLVTLLAVLSTASAADLGTGFTYQGELKISSAPANGVYDFQFRLFNALSSGDMVGAEVLVENATVSNGIFNVELDFGAGSFKGEQSWLDIGVRDGASIGAYQGLAPRQKLTATPYALHANRVAKGAVGSSEIADDSVTAVDLASNSVGADELADGAVDTTAVQDGAINSAKVADNSLGAIDLATNSVGADEIATNAVGADEIASNSVGTSEIISSQVQRRVSGSCDSGFYLAGINEDGSVLCAVLPLGLAYTLDAMVTGFVGKYTSIAIRPASGLPIISYWDQTNNDLKVYDCSNAACSAGTARTLDAVGDVGQYTSIAIRPASGLPIISYWDQTNDDLKVYDCTNAACSAGTARTLDATGIVGWHTSIAIRPASGLPIISYWDGSNNDLKVYDCSNAACSAGTARTLDATGNVGQYTSIAIRPASGLPIISYWDATNNDLKVYDCSNAACSAGTARTLDATGNVGTYTGIAIRPASGLPIISYTDGSNSNLKVYDCSNVFCSAGAGRTLDVTGDVGFFTSIAIRPASGLPIISYYDDTNDDLKVYDCIHAGCLYGIARTLDATGSIGWHTSIAINPASGLPIISYQAQNNGHLKVYSCGDSRCEN